MTTKIAGRMHKLRYGGTTSEKRVLVVATRTLYDKGKTAAAGVMTYCFCLAHEAIRK